MDHSRQRSHVPGARPPEGAGETAIEQDEQVPATQTDDRSLEFRHLKKGGRIITTRVLREKVTDRAIVALHGNPMASEVEEQTVFLANGGRQLFAKQLGK